MMISSNGDDDDDICDSDDEDIVSTINQGCTNITKPPQTSRRQQG
jgi:hypothetical protein